MREERCTSGRGRVYTCLVCTFRNNDVEGVHHNTPPPGGKESVIRPGNVQAAEYGVEGDHQAAQEEEKTDVKASRAEQDEAKVRGEASGGEDDRDEVGAALECLLQ